MWLFFTKPKLYKWISRPRPILNIYQQLFKNGQPLVKYSTLRVANYKEEEKEISKKGKNSAKKMLQKLRIP